MPRTTRTTSALQALHRSLGDRAELLDYLPYGQLRVEAQGEVPSAVPKALFFGPRKSKEPKSKIPVVWVYLCRRSISLAFKSYYPDGEPDDTFVMDDVLKAAHPHEAFRLATDPMRLCVLAMYYFMKLGVNTQHDLTFTKAQENILLSLCEDIHCARKARSKIVTLRLHIPVGHRLRTSVDTAPALHQSDSGVEDLSYEPSKNSNGSASFHDRPSHEPQCEDRPDNAQSNVDRYIYLEDEEPRILRDLESHDRRVQNLRESIESLQEQVNEELRAAEPLREKQKATEQERKRLWNAMSKDDLRELGRRDMSNKRRRTP